MIDFGMPLLEPTIQGVDLIPNCNSQIGQMQSLALQFAHTVATLAHLIIIQIEMIDFAHCSTLLSLISTSTLACSSCGAGYCTTFLWYPHLS